MIAIDNQPRLNELHRLIEAVNYPVSIKRLVAVASQKKFSPQVINFYKKFPRDQILNREDLEARTEQIEIMQTQSPPAEDDVRGAED